MPVLSKRREELPEALPVPWFPGFLRRGYFAEIGAATNVGKSFVAMRWALHMAQLGHPILYCGGDTPLTMQGERLFAMVHGRGEQYEGEMTRWLKDNPLPFRWCDLSMSTGDLDMLISAETLYFGESPALVIIDVLGEYVQGEESVSAVSGVVTDLKAIARDHKSCVLALHHLRDGAAAEGNSPVQLSDFRYEKGKYADYVFGLWRWGHGRLVMQVLKNRGGERGQLAELTFDPGRGHIEFSS